MKYHFSDLFTLLSEKIERKMSRRRANRDDVKLAVLKLTRSNDGR